MIEPQETVGARAERAKLKAQVKAGGALTKPGDHEGRGERPLRVAVGVMAHDEVQNIANCVRAILDEGSGSVAVTSVVVVASGCTDGTEAAARDAAGGDPRLRLIVESTRSGKASAINRFLAATSEPVCVITGGDVIFTPGSLSALVEPLVNPDIAMTGARPMPTNRRAGLVGQAIHLLWELHHEVALRAPKMGEAVAFRRLFDSIETNTLVDEAEIERSVKAQGGELCYVPAAIVLNHGPENLVELFRQRRRIHFGHSILKSKTGYQPSTMRLNLIAVLLLSKLQFRPAPMLGLGALLSVELLARTSAKVRFVLNGPEAGGVWRSLPSSKRLVVDGETLRRPHNGDVVLYVTLVGPARGWRHWPDWCTGAVRVLIGRRRIVRSLRPEDRVGIGFFRLRIRLRTDGAGAAVAGTRLAGTLSGVCSSAEVGGRVPSRWRGLLGDRYLRASVWLVAATSTVTLSSYLMNFAVSRMLPRPIFGEIAALLSLFVLLTVPMSAVQTLVTREEAGNGRPAGHYFGGARRAVLPLIGLGLIAGIAASPLVQSFLHLESPMPCVLLAVLSMATLWLAVYRGLLQGRRRFASLALNVALEAGFRLALSLGFVLLGLNVSGVMGGFAASALLLVVISWRMARPLLGRDFRPQVLEAVTAARELLPVAGALACTTAFFNIDVMLARHFLPPAEASDYAALSLMARLPFYLTSSMGGAIIVSVAAASKAAERKRLLAVALALATSVALGGAFVYALMGRFLVGAVFGSSYQAAAPVLPLISLGMVGLSATNVLVYFLLAFRRVRFIGLLALAVLLELALVAWRHGSPTEIASDLVLATSGAALGLLIVALRMPVASTSSQEYKTA